MIKPLVFNYRDYEELKQKYEDLLFAHGKVLCELTNLRIRCRIAEADLNLERSRKNDKE